MTIPHPFRVPMPLYISYDYGNLMIVDIEAFGYLTQKRAVKTAPRLTIPFARQGEFSRTMLSNPDGAPLPR